MCMATAATGRNESENRAETLSIRLQVYVPGKELNYSMSIGRTFSTVFPHPDTWMLFYQQSMAYYISTE